MMLVSYKLGGNLLAASTSGQQTLDSIEGRSGIANVWPLRRRRIYSRSYSQREDARLRLSLMSLHLTGTLPTVIGMRLGHEADFAQCRAPATCNFQRNDDQHRTLQ